MDVILNPYSELKNIVLSGLSSVDDIIKGLAENHVELIPEILNHLNQSEGKRIRPILTLACAKAIDGKNPGVVKLAAAVELIHTATLFHDDVIDESNLRRGRETANSIWGNKASILIGDFLLSHAFKLMIEAGKMEALEMLIASSITIIEAEVWQLDLIGKISEDTDAYIKLIMGKTASLFAASCAVSAVLNSADLEIKNALHEYGMNLGILYQITDDLLDYSAKQEVFGKKIGSDFLEKKMTLPLIVLLNCVSDDERKIIIQHFYSDNPNIGIIVELFSKYDIAKGIEEFSNLYREKAINALSQLPTSDIKDSLAKLAEYITARQV
jgi:octaprenyl-diphosphate synthase